MKLTAKQLKTRLREEGLPTSGLKAELVGRLAARLDPPSQRATSSTSSAPPPPGANEIIDAIEKINPDWKASFSAAADLRADVNENAANAAGSGDDALSRSVGRPINIMLFASEVPVIAGLNPYR